MPKSLNFIPNALKFGAASNVLFSQKGVRNIFAQCKVVCCMSVPLVKGIVYIEYLSVTFRESICNCPRMDHISEINLSPVSKSC